MDGELCMIERKMDRKEDETLKVEEFQNWVWVYDVEPADPDQPNYDRVYFTGDNVFPTDLDAHEFARWYRQNTNLPWRSGKSWAMEDPQTGTLISSIELVWNWWAYVYEWDGTPNPSATTRYYDGSS